MPTVPAYPKVWATNDVPTAAEANGNFDHIRNSVNASCVFVDVASQTISVNITHTATQTFSPLSGNALTVTTGTSAFQAVTGTTANFSSTGTFGGLLTVSAGGAAVTGAVTLAGNVAITTGQGTIKYYDAGDSGTAITVNWNNGQEQRIRLTGTATVTLTNPVAGTWYILDLVQDGTGSRPLPTFSPVPKYDTGSAPTLTTTINKKDKLWMFYNGTDYEAGLAATNLNTTH